MEFLLVFAVGLAAGTLGGIVGFGASIMLMPVLVIVFGPLQAVPIMGIAAVIGNASRVAAWWKDVNWRVCAAYAATGAPAAALGAVTLLSLPARAIEGALGAFFLLMIPVRHWLTARKLKLGVGGLALVGAPVGYLSGVVVTTGPITVPIFLACGLVKGAFVGTEAAASLAVYASKIAVFGGYGALPPHVVLEGVIAGAALTAGTFVAKRYVVRLGAGQFRLLMDGLMLVSGLVMLWSAAAA